MQNVDGANAFLTAVEAAQRLGVSDTAVRKWIANGSIQASKHGRGWRIPTAEVERLWKELNAPQTQNDASNKPNESLVSTEHTEQHRTNESKAGSLSPSLLELENQGLRRERDAALERAVSAENRLQSALDSIQGLTEQIDHFTHLLAMSQKTTQQLSDQNQLLLEDTRKKPSWWKRMLKKKNPSSPSHRTGSN